MFTNLSSSRITCMQRDLIRKEKVDWQPEPNFSQIATRFIKLRGKYGKVVFLCVTVIHPTICSLIFLLSRSLRVLYCERRYPCRCFSGPAEISHRLESSSHAALILQRTMNANHKVSHRRIFSFIIIFPFSSALLQVHSDDMKIYTQGGKRRHFIIQRWVWFSRRNRTQEI